MATGLLRIGEFARRVGVDPELLRAWERRYGLLRPVRSSGGFRLYTPEDEERVARMRRGLGSGLSAAEAARAALEEAGPATRPLASAADRLFAAITHYDEPAAQAVLDASIGSLGVDALLREVVLPTLVRVGDEWEHGRLEVAQEHFATNVVRGRLLALARLWGRGGGPLAILACAPGEQHDVGLLAFGIVLRSHGWRVLFLGADTPFETLARAAETSRAALAVVTSVDAARLEAGAVQLARLATATPLALAGPGASEPLCDRLGARYLDGDLVAAGDEVAASLG
jgi:DNA-binding transcriptional MerR regulator